MINLNDKLQRQIVKKFLLKIIDIGRMDSKINKDYCPDFLFIDFQNTIAELYSVSDTDAI